MSSNINPNNIDGYFPIAGQDNDSQGFRDNFTNIKNNLNFAKNEISDIQNKAILKSPLSGTGTVNNNMAGAILSNVSLNSDSHIFLDHGTIGDPGITTNYDLDYWLATVHAVTTAGSLNFSLRNFPLGKFASIRLLINVTNTAHTIYFDGTSNQNGFNRIEGFQSSGSLITFSSANTFPQVFMFEISSPDGGSTINVVDLFRGRSKTDGNLTVNGKLTVTNGLIDSNLLELTIASNVNVMANVNYHTWILNTISSATIANAWITLPAVAEHGREIIISTLAPITSANITTANLTLGNVKWSNTSIFSNGNVSAKFVYSTTSSAWLKV
jgi:hypothetical protein